MSDNPFADVDAAAAQEAWLELVRARIREGRAAYARGDLIKMTPDELMDGIARELDLL